MERCHLWTYHGFDLIGYLIVPNILIGGGLGWDGAGYLQLFGATSKLQLHSCSLEVTLWKTKTFKWTNPFNGSGLGELMMANVVFKKVLSDGD